MAGKTVDRRTIVEREFRTIFTWRPSSLRVQPLGMPAYSYQYGIFIYLNLHGEGDHVSTNAGA